MLGRIQPFNQKYTYLRDSNRNINSSIYYKKEIKMIKFRSPIYWEKKFNGQLSVLCQTCGVRYMTTFAKFKKNKECSDCVYKVVDQNIYVVYNTIQIAISESEKCGGKRDPMSVPDRPKIVEAIERVFKENKELLDKLGSDYDENGVPYWEHYEERLKHMEENGI